MLSGAQGMAARPKPPANRRPPSQLRRTPNPSDKENGATTAPAKPANRDHLDVPTSPSDPPAQERGIVLDRDLDLDLPADLTAALERNLQRWPKQRGRVSSAACQPSTEAGAKDKDEAASYGSLGRTGKPRQGYHGVDGVGSEGRTSQQAPSRAGASARPRPTLRYVFSTPDPPNRYATSDQATQNTPDPISPPLGSAGFAPRPRRPSLDAKWAASRGDARGGRPELRLGGGVDEDENSNNDADDDDAIRDRDDGSDARSLASDTSSFDQEWVGNLNRDELEAMLMQANRIIKERERDLGIAAAIGKALLEKNISLRNRHNGLASRLASSTSIFEMGEAAAEPTKPPCSPPTTDTALAAAPDGIDNEKTPMPSGTGRGGTADYFGHATLSTPFRTVASGARQPLGPVSAAPQMSSGGGAAGSMRSTASASSLDTETSKQQQTPTLATYGGGNPWIPSQAGLIVSQPPSPSGSTSNFASFRGLDALEGRTGAAQRRARARPALSQTQAAEAQRQLAALSEQNEALLQQLSELQEEAEKARREGSKKLSRLNKEIGGLKTELEAATLRNSELEQTRSQKNDDANGGGDRIAQRRKAWTRGGGVGPVSPLIHGTMNLGMQAERTPVRGHGHHLDSVDDPVAEPLAVEQLRVSASTTDASSVTDDEGAGAASASPWDLEEMLGYRPGNSEGERALVAQLLAKIQELQETNRAMAEAGNEMDGKLGRAMEEGERLKDAYAAVENSSAVADSWTDGDDLHREGWAAGMPAAAGVVLSGTMTPSSSRGSLGLLDSSPISLAPGSSPTRRRRAPGNRYTIESRKTVRAALRRERKESKILGGKGDVFGRAPEMVRSTTDDSLASYSLDLSMSSSTASSPNSRRIVKKVSGTSIGLGAAMRPRIRITPSIEDLGARRRTTEVTIDGDEGVKKGTSASASSKDWEDLPSSAIADGADLSGSKASSLKPSDALQRPLASSTAAAHNEAGSPAPLTPRSERDGPAPTGSSPTSSDRAGHVRGGPLLSLPVTPERSAMLSYRGYSLSSLVSMSRSSSMNDTSDIEGPPRRTLGSELGSIFGGDEPRSSSYEGSDLGGGGRDESGPTIVGAVAMTTTAALEGSVLLGDLDDGGSSQITLGAASPLPQNRYRKSDRPTASFGRLVSEEEADEDQEDLECVLQHPVGNVKALLRLQPPSPQCERDRSLIARLADEHDGVWRAGDDIVESGGLKDRQQPRSDQYDLICTAVEEQPVHWADDDDFGKPITETEARRIGLVQLPHPDDRASAYAGGRQQKTLQGRSKSSILLGLAWAAGKKIVASGQGDRQEEAAAVTSRDASRQVPRLQIEEEQQIAERQRLELLLRRRRVELLRSRGYDVEGDYELDGRSLEAEIDARVLAFSPARHRLRAEKARASRASYLGEGQRLEYGREAREQRSQEQYNGGPDYGSKGKTEGLGKGRDTGKDTGKDKGKGKGKARLLDSDHEDVADSDQNRFSWHTSTVSSTVARRRARRSSGRPSLDRADSGAFTGSTSEWVRATSAAHATVTATDTVPDTVPDTRIDPQGAEAAMSPGDDSETSSDFELLELPVEGTGPASRRVKRQGDWGTDYYPISLRARYQPAMVKQRVKVASNEAIVWISTWVTFTTVIVFAFVVAMRRGPAPVLGTSGSTGTSMGASRRGGGPLRRRTTSIERL
ncbi:hypothetical protein ACQY0O_001785 [Thecaphora frezii]